MKPILVTGAAGFIGARFIESCNQRGIPVLSVDHLKHFTARMEHIVSKVDFNHAVERDDILDYLDENPDNMSFSAIVHMGACSDTFQLDEDYLRKNNTEFSQNLWEFAQSEKIPFVYASSGATYGAGELGYDDDEKLLPKLKPLNPYGVSKHRFDTWVLEQERLGHTPPNWAGFKFFNVYGFGERHKTKMSSLVVQAFDQIRSTGKVRLFKSHRSDIADGAQSRDFIHVDDVVKVLHFALDHPIKRGIYNLGSGKARSFHDLVRAVFKELGKPERIEFIDTPEHLRARYQYFTEAKMDRLRAAGYTEPFQSIEEGVHKYVGQLLQYA